VPSISTSTILAFGSKSSIRLFLFSPAAIVLTPQPKSQPLTTLPYRTQFPHSTVLASFPSLSLSLYMAAGFSCQLTSSNLNSETEMTQPEFFAESGNITFLYCECQGNIRTVNTENIRRYYHAFNYVGLISKLM
jgi:hypothetical protein